MTRGRCVVMTVFALLTLVNLWLVRFFLKVKRLEQVQPEMGLRFRDILVMSVDDVHPIQHLEEAVAMTEPNTSETTSSPPDYSPVDVTSRIPEVSPSGPGGQPFLGSSDLPTRPSLPVPTGWGTPLGHNQLTESETSSPASTDPTEAAFSSVNREVILFEDGVSGFLSSSVRTTATPPADPLFSYELTRLSQQTVTVDTIYSVPTLNREQRRRNPDIVLEQINNTRVSFDDQKELPDSQKWLNMKKLLQTLNHLLRQPKVSDLNSTADFISVGNRVASSPAILKELEIHTTTASLTDNHVSSSGQLTASKDPTLVTGQSTAVDLLYKLMAERDPSKLSSLLLENSQAVTTLLRHILYHLQQRRLRGKDTQGSGRINM